MRFIRRNCDPDSKVFEMTKAVAGKYLECLNNKWIFEMKMKRLIVYPFDLPVTCTFGATLNGQARNEVVLVYNETGSSKFLAFVIAHEMAHILMYPQRDLLAVTKRKIRYTLDGKECSRKNVLQEVETDEALADYLGFYIASKLDYEDNGGAMEEYFRREKVAHRREVTSQLELTCGKPLMECEKIDEYHSQGDDLVISNSLWYNCVTHFLEPEKYWTIA